MFVAKVINRKRLGKLPGPTFGLFDCVRREKANLLFSRPTKQRRGTICPLLWVSLIFFPEEGIQQLFVLFAFVGDVVAVGAGEVEEVAFGDDILATGFEGSQPAAVQPAADGVHGVAEERGDFALRECIAEAAPFILEPPAQIGGRFGRVWRL